jgi:hypothetical protein
VSIKLLAEVKKKLVETTLLDRWNSKWQYDQLKKACTIRCCPSVPDRNMFVLKSGHKWVAAVPHKAREAVFELWARYLYTSKGDISLKHIRGDASRPPSVGPLDKAENIRSWLATGTPDDPPENLDQTVEDAPCTQRSETSTFAGPMDTGML